MLLLIIASFYKISIHIGGIVRVCGLAMTPRVILMTDGEPTDREGPEKVRDTYYHANIYL